MGKEQELRPPPCPFCGGTEGVGSIFGNPKAACPWHIECNDCCACGPLANTESLAWEMWNRRSSSDEQRAEVVDGPPDELLAAAKNVLAWMNQLPIPTTGCTAKGKLLYDAIAKTERLASPSPAVAAGGVTEEMVAAAKAELFTSRIVDVFSVRRALTAALAVRDEGMRDK